MKTKYKIILFLVIFSLIMGCSLEEKIYDTTVSDAFVQTEDNALSLINGLYSYFPTFASYKSNFHRINLYSGDDIAVTSSTYAVYNNRSLPTTDRYLPGPWRVFFQVINVANSLINVIEENTILSDEFKARSIGQGRFMRAFSYFDLVRVWGDVPLLLEPTTGDSDFYPSRSSVDEIYAQIFEDFKYAAENLLPYSEQPVKEFGFATKGAAQAMLSLAYLTYANYKDLHGQSSDAPTYYQLAEDYADLVISSNEYSLVQDYADLWDVSKEKSAYQEVIFSIMHTRDATAASASSRGNELPYYAQPSRRYHISGQPPNGAGAGVLKLQPWFVEQYLTGEYENDYRAEVSFLTRFPYGDTPREVITFPEIKKADEVVEQFPYLDKYKDPDAYQGRNSENDFFIMRLAEVYLIKAEAENELNGPTADAYNAFNKLRERARMADGNVRSTPADLEQGLTKEEFRLKIYNERGLELVGEGHRWYDSIRMRYLDNTRPMVQYRYEEFYPSLGEAATKAPSYNTQTNTWGVGRVSTVNVATWSKRFLLWPIPSEEIDANPKMTQNVEYGW